MTTPNTADPVLLSEKLITTILDGLTITDERSESARQLRALVDSLQVSAQAQQVAYDEMSRALGLQLAQKNDELNEQADQIEALVKRCQKFAMEIHGLQSMLPRKSDLESYSNATADAQCWLHGFTAAGGTYYPGTQLTLGDMLDWLRRFTHNLPQPSVNTCQPMAAYPAGRDSNAQDCRTTTEVSNVPF